MFADVIGDEYKDNRDELAELCCTTIRVAATTRLETVILHGIISSKTEGDKKEAKAEVLKEERIYSSRYRLRKEDNAQQGLLKKRLEVFK